MTIANKSGKGPDDFPDKFLEHNSSTVKCAIDPVFLVEVQGLVETALVFATGVLAKLVYLDLILRSDQPLLPFAGAALVGSIITHVVFSRAGMHDPAKIMTLSFDVKRLSLALVLVFLLVVSLLFLLKSAEAFSRGWIAVWFGLSWCALLAERAIARIYFKLLMVDGRLRKRIAVYGPPALVMDVVRAFFKREQSTALVGIYDDPELGKETTAPVDGGLNDLIEFAREGKCDRIIVAMPSSAKDRISTIITSLAVLPIEVQLCPDALRLPCTVPGSIGDGPLLMLDVQRSPLNARGIIFKNILDRTLAAIALIAAAPLMLLIALAIKLDTSGPIFFIQARHGFNNRVIWVFKFRTMNVLENGSVVVQAQRNDARVTRVGRFLRRTSLDELPQLFNVLRGNLSLVGPRPHAVAHNEHYALLIENYLVRHKIKPGITGWAQVNGLRGETRDPSLMRRRVEFDLWYVNNWSWWLDIRILLKTIFVIFDRRAY